MDIIEIVLLSLFLTAVVVVGGILGIIAFARSFGLRKELSRLRQALGAIEGRLARWEKAAPPPGAAVPPAAEPVEEAPATPAAPPPPPPPVPAAPPAAAVPAAAGPPAGPPPVEAPAAAAAAEGGIGSLESRIGKRWMTWVGVAVLFVSAALFLKYAFDNKWIGPTGQVVISALAGLATLICGSRFLSRRWQIFGQSLMGLGLAILYVTFYAAASLYEPPVMSQTMAFGFMLAVTVAGMALGVMHNALSMAFVAVLGGLLTPVLVSTGVDARDALFSYLLLLNLGVLAVAFFRRWRLLDALAMAGTFVLYAGWHGRFYKAEALIPAMAWLAAFYVVFLALPVTYHLLRRVPFTLERFILALANAVFTFAFAWHMLHEDYKFVLGFVALGMAAAYVLLGSVVRRRLPDDARTLFGAVALAVALLTLAVPLHLRANGIMLAWVVEGPVLLYLGFRFRYRPVRVFAAAVVALSVLRLFGAHWPLHHKLYIPFVNRQFITAIIVPVATAAYALIHHRFRAEAGAIDRALKVSTALGAGLLALIVLHAELGMWLEQDFSSYVAGCAVTALWALGALGFLLAGARARSAAAWTWGVGALALLIALVLGAVAFEHGLGRGHLLFLNLRFAACLLAAAVAFAYARIVRTTPAGGENTRRAFAAVFLAAGLVTLLALLSTEAYSFCVDRIRDHSRAHRAGQMAITLVWSVYAAGLIFVGFWRRWRPIRLAALGLFGLSALKLVLVDLTHVRDIYRIVSFLVLGLLMVGASYLYHRLEKRLLASQGIPASAGAGGAEGGPR